MTAFSDYSSPRPGTDDLYFSRAADQSRIVPPPIITTRDERLPLPLDLLILFLSVIGIILVVILGGGILGLRWIRARRNAKESVVRV